METKQIPIKVQQSFKSLSEMFGDDNNVHIGNREGADYYLFQFPDDTGFPNVIAYKNGNVSNITGLDAVNIVALFNLED